MNQFFEYSKRILPLSFHLPSASTEIQVFLNIHHGSQFLKKQITFHCGSRK